VRLSDVRLLSDALQQTRARLVIVDPVQSYLGAEVDAHRSNETRPVKDGLSRLAEEHGCCVMLVRHLSKAPTGKAIHRGLGSIDLTGAVRTELLAGCLPDDPAQRALVQVKSNLGQFGPSLGYIIEADGKFRWTGESELTAAALLAPESNEKETGALVEAKDFLLSTLSQGPRLPEEIQAEAQRLGISARTLRRAKEASRVRSRKGSMSSGWEWSLPEVGQE
jgi:AAA domain